MSALKDIYTPSFFDCFADAAEGVLPAFNRKKFVRRIFTGDWESMELKQRMRHTTLVLHQFMDQDFVQAARQIAGISSRLQQQKISENTLGFIFLPDYIEVHGLPHFKASVKAMEQVTQFISCEFAVRPFILNYKDEMLMQMHAWSKHKNHHVRRLASEGSRPRLPWAMAIPSLKKDPAPILPLLDNLKQDPSEYVRRSVANSLNDIAKDHPSIVIDIAGKWKGISSETDAIIRHGCRTLLKQGNAAMLKFYGLSGSSKLEVSGLKLITPKVKVGSDLLFSFLVTNGSSKEQVVRLEYAIYYLRQNGQLSRKVFKISERSFKPGEKALITKKQSFRVITTRRFYPGQHKFSIILNGQERALGDFELE